ncbi:MAG TPA: indole-3-glycerol-phosphate synthase [Candidatus Nitrosotalea sp.]|nr:indole-3-glycerol-phosphate synthase [Candidatus Nitrosotalea sp.]
MKNMLERLAKNSQQAIKDGTYEINYNNKKSEKNLVEQIRNNKHASLITEVKFSSPSLGNIRQVSDPVAIAKQMVEGGAVGLSVLTQPYLFNGSPDYFTKIRKEIKIPLLMKDIVVDKVQIDAAEKLGADVILLIQAIFDMKFANDIDEFVSYAHKKNLLVLLESHTKKEFLDSTKTQSDILGINNRNLDTLEISLDTTKTILEKRDEKRIIISESGVESPEDIQFLRKCGADAFLVGSSIMKSKDIKGLVSELVLAI